MELEGKNATFPSGHCWTMCISNGASYSELLQRSNNNRPTWHRTAVVEARLEALWFHRCNTAISTTHTEISAHLLQRTNGLLPAVIIHHIKATDRKLFRLLCTSVASHC